MEWWKISRYICFWRRKMWWYKIHFSYTSGAGNKMEGADERYYDHILEFNEWPEIQWHLEHSEALWIMCGDSRIGTNIASGIKLIKAEAKYWTRL